jgi:Fe-S-cluster containining protein
MRGDHQFVQIVDAALAEASRKAGDWLACRPGCFQCCLGPFPITQGDADRLRRGWNQLDPDVAARVQARARESVARPESDDEPCPALDPSTGTCDLYAARPITCRTFGPAVRFGGGPVGVCELCFVGATEEQIASCAVDLDIEEPDGETTVACALSGS